MPIPELIVLAGVERAWQFLRERLDDHILYLLDDFPMDKQERFRQQIISTPVPALLSPPNMTPSLPCILISPGGEQEEGAFLANTGADHRHMPHMPVRPEDFDPEPFYGTVYNTASDQPAFLGRDQEVQNTYPKQVPVRRQNLKWQRQTGSTGDEQYHRLAQTPRIWNEDLNRLMSTAFLDMGNVQISVKSANAEQAIVYGRLLRWVLRRFQVWFEGNGLQNVQIGIGPMQEDPASRPGAGAPVYMRPVFVTYKHLEYSIEVVSVLAEWMLTINMVTQDANGRVSVTPIAQTLSGVPSP